MFLIDTNKPFTLIELTEVLQRFQTEEVPKLLHWKNYYDGKQAILYKKATDVGRPCNKVVVNFAYNITHNYLGYLAGKPITYESNTSLDDIIQILNYNDVHEQDVEYLRQALIYGIAYCINYIDEDGKQRFKLLDPRETFAIYDNTLNNNLVYGVRCWREDRIEEDEAYMVEVYSDVEVKKYSSVPGFTSFTLLETRPNYFNQVPITVFKLNEDEVPIFNQILSLQDAYNTLLSGEVDDWEQWADAYLVLKGAQADEDTLNDAKQKRCLMMDTDCSAEYLTKSVNDTQIQNMLDNVKKQIHMIASSPDFTDEKFMAQSGVAIKYKLVGFENAAAAIESQMKKALQKRIELICSILKLTDEETIWRDITITIPRNLPDDLLNLADVISKLRGIVSDKTLLAQIPFVRDADEELKIVKEQTKENMELYSFNEEGNTNGTENEEEEPER